MPNDNAITRLLYAILSQKCLKDIDWNKVAHDPILSQEITNGHAARMRYSRFKKQMEGNTAAVVKRGPRTPKKTSRVEKASSNTKSHKKKERRESPAGMGVKEERGGASGSYPTPSESVDGFDESRQGTVEATPETQTPSFSPERSFSPRMERSMPLPDINNHPFLQQHNIKAEPGQPHLHRISSPLTHPHPYVLHHSSESPSPSPGQHGFMEQDMHGNAHGAVDEFLTSFGLPDHGEMNGMYSMMGEEHVGAAHPYGVGPMGGVGAMPIGMMPSDSYNDYLVGGGYENQEHAGGQGSIHTLQGEDDTANVLVKTEPRWDEAYRH